MQAACSYPAWEVEVDRIECPCCGTNVLLCQITFHRDPDFGVEHDSVTQWFRHHEVKRNAKRMDQWCAENVKPLIESARKFDQDEGAVGAAG